MTFEQLARAPSSELERLIRSSAGPAPAVLAGWIWRGRNLSPITKLLGIEKFIKGFFKSAYGIEGYNIPARQNGVDREWLAKPSFENPKRFGFYRVAPVDPASRDNFYPRAVLLDYGASPRNAAYKPERVLRDYLVMPDAARPDLLLGKAYLALAGARVKANFFVLERFKPSSWAG